MRWLQNGEDVGGHCAACWIIVSFQLRERTSERGFFLSFFQLHSLTPRSRGGPPPGRARGGSLSYFGVSFPVLAKIFPTTRFIKMLKFISKHKANIVSIHVWQLARISQQTLVPNHKCTFRYNHITFYAQFSSLSGRRSRYHDRIMRLCVLHTRLRPDPESDQIDTCAAGGSAVPGGLGWLLSNYQLH